MDRSAEQIGQDIALMQQAGFTLVRMGDLSWDAFEPSEGHFEFAWLDSILAAVGNLWRPERHYPHVGLSRPDRLPTNLSRVDLQRATGRGRQALFGLLDHDGTPSWKYAEFKQIAGEFAKLQHFGFPRYRKPEVAIAYSFESNVASHSPGPSNTVRQYFTVGYVDQVESAVEPFFEDNIDVALINIGHSTLDYKLVVVPADYVMDAASAEAIRNYVHNGGTATFSNVATDTEAKRDRRSSKTVLR